jgi:Domain of unknown function (DUF4293)
MIQRIQTILLFLASAACVAFLFAPTWWVQNNNDEDGSSISISTTPMKALVESSAMSLDNPFTEKTLSFTENTFLLLQFGVTIGAAILLLVTIFLFSNRGLQIKLGYGALFLLMGVNILMIPIRNWIQDMAGQPSMVADMYLSGPKWGLALPLLALLLTWWAVKRIQKDEKLVQGMDRLR